MNFLSLSYLLLSLWAVPLFSYAQIPAQYKIGIENIEYLPFFDASPDANHVTGYTVELFASFFQQQQAALSYSRLPLKRLFKTFLYEDTLDFKFPDSPLWKPQLRLDKTIYYSLPIANITNGLVINRNNAPATINHINSIGTIRGIRPAPYLAYVESGRIQHIEFSHINDLLNALLAKRIDAAYLSKNVAHHHIQQYFIEQKTQLSFADNLPLEDEIFYLSSKQHPTIIKKLNHFLRHNPEIIKKLADHYQLTPLRYQ
ncbi:transporter substrate-binding domain-containing protein [Dasania marina]|uniref:transporter substrate-binding domain-containing protein n=1 Tax=Dasania marina TaxID=471499 RepID=UPI0030DD4C34|tara:strand:- start:20887 stop:21660 length:774 start_codon:yes stop_codon:yes gene_type:complete